MPNRGSQVTGAPAVSFAQIKAYADEIARYFRPKRIILFGSYAYGRPNADSDVDLLVIMPHAGSPPEQAARIRNTIRAPFALDLIVRTPRKLQERLAMDDWFMHEVVEKGRVLHEG